MANTVKRMAFFPTLFALTVVFSCVTINIYFPAAAVEKAADEIVEETWGEKGTKPETKEEEKKGFFDNGSRFVGLTIGFREAHAQEADINVTTPAIRTLKDSIGARAVIIKPFMDRGNAGITNEGLLTVRSVEGLSLKEKADLNRLIDAENKDRETLYREIAQANGFGPDRIPDIKAIFAKSWIKNARSGWLIQNPDGAWAKKVSP